MTLSAPSRKKAVFKPELQRMKERGLNRLREPSAKRRTKEKLSKEEKGLNF